MTNIQIHIQTDDPKAPFSGREYIINPQRPAEPYTPLSLMIYGNPFANIGLGVLLGLAIHTDGTILFRGWELNQHATSPYFYPTKDCPQSMQLTQKQKDTVAGLFSGRILFEGLRLLIGSQIQQLCPVNIEAEARRFHKIPRVSARAQTYNETLRPEFVQWDDPEKQKGETS